MTISGWFQIAVFFTLLILTAKPLGSYMAKVYSGEKTFLSVIIKPIESFFYRLAGISAEKEMNWKE
ncbi:MAG TPA: potassium-transporting ATPase subunit KdpA, partial [Leptolinea sp.]